MNISMDIWATALDGTPAARPKAMMPENYPIHATSTGRVLPDEKRQTKLDKQEEEYETLTAEARKAPDPWLMSSTNIEPVDEKTSKPPLKERRLSFALGRR